MFISRKFGKVARANISHADLYLLHNSRVGLHYLHIFYKLFGGVFANKIAPLTSSVRLLKKYSYLFPKGTMAFNL